ncbi:MAG: molybdopterin molybdotransferase MoeA [Sulfolobus sp.]|nr:molybdopterin molybdotransferase MoeA [Sulfolobus sp.]
MDVEEAHSRIDRSFSQIRATRRVKVWDAVNRVIAEDVYSPIDVPERDIAAMDGYAVNVEGLEKYGKLKVVGKSFPNTVELPPIEDDQAVYVTTGSPIPPGANAVIRIEAARLENGYVTSSLRPRPGQDIRPLGEDFRKGDLLIPKGSILTERHLGLLLRANVDEVEVVDLRSCVFATGDELVPYYVSDSGKVRDSIGPIIASYLKRFGTVEYLGVVKDDPHELERVLVDASLRCDLILSIGGSSMGERDFVKSVVSRLGDLVFEGVNTNVIKRCGVGKVNGKAFVSLPGQVVSAVTSFHEFGLHVLEALSGLKLRKVKEVELAQDLEVKHHMDSVYLIKLTDHGATPLRWGVGLYSELAKADGYAIFKRGRKYGKGERFEVKLFI